MRVAIGLVCLLATLAGGCASTSGVNAGPEAVTRVYQYPYETVFNATVAAAKAKKLAVVATDVTAGTVTLAHGGTWQNWGETIAVQVKPLTGDFTEVAIVNAPRFEFLTFSPSWGRILQQQIDLELRPSLSEDVSFSVK